MGEQGECALDSPFKEELKLVEHCCLPRAYYVSVSSINGYEHIEEKEVLYYRKV